MKMPPEPARNSGRGGAISRCAARNKYTSPSSPARTRSAAAEKAGSKRRWKPTWSLTPAASSASTTSTRHIAFQRERLLTEDVLARLSRAHSLARRGPRRRGDDDARRGTGPDQSRHRWPQRPHPVGPQPGPPRSGRGSKIADQLRRRAPARPGFGHGQHPCGPAQPRPGLALSALLSLPSWRFPPAVPPACQSQCCSLCGN